MLLSGLAHVLWNTIRLRLLKIGAVILCNTRRIQFLLSSTHSHQELLFNVAAKPKPPGWRVVADPDPRRARSPRGIAPRPRPSGSFRRFRSPNSRSRSPETCPKSRSSANRPASIKRAVKKTSITASYAHSCNMPASAPQPAGAYGSTTLSTITGHPQETNPNAPLTIAGLPKKTGDLPKTPSKLHQREWQRLREWLNGKRG